MKDDVTRSLAARYYTDPSIYELEKERIFSRAWICLGHQCIGEVYGGKVTRAPRLMHGKTSPIYHYDDRLFRGIPSPFKATRYHSLIVDPTTLPDELEITAESNEGVIMGCRLRGTAVHGVLFHPESFLTPPGRRLLRNFMSEAILDVD